MKVKYVGESFGVTGLTSNKTYECLGVESPFLRVIDDEEDDYLYPIINPGPMTDPNWVSRWVIVEDDRDGTLAKAIGTGD